MTALCCLRSLLLVLRALEHLKSLSEKQPLKANSHSRGSSLAFGKGMLMYLFGVGQIDSLGSEISRSQVCYVGSETQDRRDYLGSVICVFKNFFTA